MPYFKWTGVNITGDIKKGKIVAYSEQELSEKLFQRGIALLHCKSLRTISYFWSNNASIKAQLFSAIARLLQAGILMPEVFVIAGQQLDNPLLYDALFEWSTDLKNGLSFVSTVKKQTQLCDPVVITMLTAGHESGNFTTAVENAAHYYQLKHLQQRNIRSCLAMPMLTLTFFIGITLFIFIFIMPRFAEMFLSINSQLPTLTRYMISISAFISSTAMLYAILTFTLSIFIVRHYCKTTGAKIYNTFCIHIPFIGNIIRQHELSQLLQALSLLIKSGVSLPHALQILQKSIHNHVIKNYVNNVYMHIQSGMLLGQALSTMFVVSSDIIALIVVGEESGTLETSLETAANMYQERTQNMLKQMLFFMQPLIIVFLGILIGILILAVYLPIMNFSYTI